MIDAAAVDAALDRVVDPCSNALGEPLGLREMGLAHCVEIDDVHGDVHVTMRLTSPCCAFGPTMATAAQRELGAIDGVRRATVVIDHAAVWTPTEITVRANDRLAARRRHTVEMTGVAPYDWTTYDAESLRPPSLEGTS